jgi:hypothetical protein
LGFFPFGGQQVSCSPGKTLRPPGWCPGRLRRYWGGSAFRTGPRTHPSAIRAKSLAPGGVLGGSEVKRALAALRDLLQALPVGAGSTQRLRELWRQIDGAKAKKRRAPRRRGVVLAWNGAPRALRPPDVRPERVSLPLVVRMSWKRCNVRASAPQGRCTDVGGMF